MISLPSSCFFSAEAHAPDPPPLTPAFDALISLAAQADTPVLLQGEPGAGKRYLARLIHNRSHTNQLAFLEVTCEAVHSGNLWKHLFGTEPMDFNSPQEATVAIGIRGVGTLHLAQIDQLPLDAQAGLLQRLQDAQLGVGGDAGGARRSVRLMASSRTPLADALAAGRMLADLYYRLQAFALTLPPLRARTDEILPLARSILHSISRSTPTSPPHPISPAGPPATASLTTAAEEWLLTYRWPGNVRELRDTLWRAALLAQDAPIDVVHLAGPPASLGGPNGSGTVRTAHARALDAVERDAIRAALASNRGNRTRTARVLGIARSTLLEKIKRYGLT
ncbi:sigma 54-interacting transcriptional regulator [Gemmatimonas aurantiaca]|uniref:sigma 54-interacting transcriptional regulator n=1 Tax=Gemmatimonas aurantiaca TaxID=173480 RepID=UPI00301C797A